MCSFRLFCKLIKELKVIFEELFHEYKSKGKPVAGIIVEPIQSEGGDHHGSPTFFQDLQKLTKQVKIDENL